MFGASRRHTDEVARDLAERIAESRRHTDEVVAESRQHTDEVVAESRRHTDEIAGGLVEQIAESRRHFEVLAEGLRHDVQLVAEGVVANTEAIGRLEHQMKEESAETRAMIRSSYSELDHRVRALEGAT